MKGSGVGCAQSQGGSGEPRGAPLGSSQRMQAAGACSPATLSQAWDPLSHLGSMVQVAQTG